MTPEDIKNAEALAVALEFQGRRAIETPDQAAMRRVYERNDAATTIRSLVAALSQAEADRVDAERWRKASSSRNLGIAFWGEHGQGIVYDKAAEIHTDRVIKADAARLTKSVKTEG